MTLKSFGSVCPKLFAGTLTTLIVCTILPNAAFAWVAIATNERGNWGFYIDSDKLIAMRLAIVGCGNKQTGCRVVAIAKNRCFASVESRAGGYWYGFGTANNENAAVNTALRGCRLGAAKKETCRVVKAQCG